MPRFEKCNHCRYGWNNPHGCNYPDPLDPCRIDMSCYQPMTEAQKFQQKAERERKSDKTNNTKLVGNIFSGYDIIDTTNPMEMANYYASELVKKITNASVKQKKESVRECSVQYGFCSRAISKIRGTSSYDTHEL